MAVLLDGSAQAVEGFGGSASYSCPITVAANANRYLLMGAVSSDLAKTVSTYKWNTTESGSRIASIASTQQIMEMWGLVNPTAGSFNATVTWSGVCTCSMVVASFYGVDQSTPIGTPVSDVYSASGVSHSHNTVGNTDGYIVDYFAIQSGGGTVSANAGQTVIYGPSVMDIMAFMLSTKPGGASVSTGESWQNDFNRWSHITVGLNPLLSSAAITGTGSSGMTENDVKTGGKTLIITLTGDTFIAN